MFEGRLPKKWHRERAEKNYWQAKANQILFLPRVQDLLERPRGQTREVGLSSLFSYTALESGDRSPDS